ncbi:MAG: hypothetical protein CEE38_21975 [Planctomycetes bacterium B3_Pla]|nr:MAG: hypothetical protein CEE38_21975 [Planctomycetes bacterium B3_Pla]
MFYALTGLLNAVSSTVLGIFVYAKNPKRAVNKTFGLFCVFIAVWSYCYFFWLTADDAKNALLWSRLLMAGAIFVPISYLHFVLVLTEQVKKKRARTILFVGYLVFSLFFLSNFTAWFVADVQPRMGFDFWPSAGPLYAPFLLIWLSCAVYSVVLLARGYKKAAGVKKSQLSYVLLGTIVGYLGGATNYFLWYDVPVPPIGNWAITLYVFLVAYSILKHRLFDIRAIAAELFTFAIWASLLVRILLSETLRELVSNVGLFTIVFVLGILLIRSVWKEVQQREKLQVLTKQLQRLSEVKTQFILATQHHIKGPLTRMRWYLDWIFEGTYGKVPRKLKGILSQFESSTRSLIKVVDGLLDISQFQLGKEAVTLHPDIEIEPILKEIIQEHQPEARAKGLYLRLEKSAKIPTVKADPEKLKVALFNLVDNAVKYTNEGGVTIKATRADFKIQVTIEDTGAGIPKEEHKTLFTRIFEQGREGKKIHGRGRGIGLYITSQIIKAHKGRVWAESEGKGKGSTFYIELPV